MCKGEKSSFLDYDKTEYICGVPKSGITHHCRYSDLMLVSLNPFDPSLEIMKCKVCGLPGNIRPSCSGGYGVSIGNYSSCGLIDKKHKEHLPLLPSEYGLNLHIHNF